MHDLPPIALDLLAAAGVVVERHKSDPQFWCYTLPSGAHGQAETAQRAACLALNRMRGSLLYLQAAVDELSGDINRMRAQARARAAIFVRLAEDVRREWVE